MDNIWRYMHGYVVMTICSCELLVTRILVVHSVTPRVHNITDSIIDSLVTLSMLFLMSNNLDLLTLTSYKKLVNVGVRDSRNQITSSTHDLDKTIVTSLYLHICSYKLYTHFYYENTIVSSRLNSFQKFCQK